jgi:hypothetical protein
MITIRATSLFSHVQVLGFIYIFALIKCVPAVVIICTCNATEFVRLRYCYHLISGSIFVNDSLCVRYLSIIVSCFGSIKSF